MKLFSRGTPQPEAKMQKGAAAAPTRTLVERVAERFAGKPSVPAVKPMSAEMASIFHILTVLQDGKRDLETWMSGVTAVWDNPDVAKDVEQVKEWSAAVDQGIDRMRATLRENDTSLPPASVVDTTLDRIAARNLAAGSLQAHCAFLNVFFIKKDVGHLLLSRTSKVLPMSLVRISYAEQFRRISTEKVKSAALPTGLADARTTKRIGTTSLSEDRAIARAAQRAAAPRPAADAT